MSADHELYELLTDDFHAVLDDLPEAEAVDLPGLLEQGHRQLRRHRAGRAAAAAAAVVGAACLVGALIPGEPAGPRPGMTVTSSVSAAQSPAAAVADPLVTSAAFGWLPQQLTDVSYQFSASPNASPGEYDTATPTREQPDHFVAAMLSTGSGSGYDTTGMKQIAPINGHPAYTSSEGTGLLKIIFRSPSGQAAELDTQNLDANDGLTIARGIVFARKVFPFPFQVSGVDAPLARAGAQYESIDGKWVQARLDLAVKADPAYEAEIVAVPADAPPYAWSGRTATRTQNGVKIIAGLSIQVANGLQLADLYPEAGGPFPSTLVLFNDPTEYGDPAAFLQAHVHILSADPTQWTTDVLLP